MNLAGRKYLTRRPHTGYWYRAVPAHHHGDVLAVEPSVNTPSRFNPGRTDRPGVPLLYLADDPAVSLFEVRVLMGMYLPGQPAVPNPAAGGRAVMPVSVSLSGVVDLTDPGELQLLDTSIQEMTGDWVGYRERRYSAPYPPLAPTQQLGAALFRMPRVEGFLTYSAKAPSNRNLVVFPTKLRPGSFIDVPDPATGQILLSLP